MAKPPCYNISNIKTKTALFYGNHDYLADPDDVNRLITELPKESIIFQQQTKNFAHLDYTWAMNANIKVYENVTKLLKQYT